MATRVNKLDMGSNSYPLSFNGGTCDCAVVKNAGNASGFTYAGNAMTKLGEVIDNTGDYHQVWGLQNAPSGSVTVDVTGTPGTSSIETYTGIDTTAVFPNVVNTGEHHFGSGSLTEITVNVTTTEDDCILVGLGGYRGSGITNMFSGSNTLTISDNPPGAGVDLSFESNPLTTGVAGTYHLQGQTGGGSLAIVISLIVVALTPGVSTSTFTPQALII